MELSNLLFRYRGTEVAGGTAWQEAIALLELMLAPAAPHVTEELWARHLAARGEAWRSIHTERWPALDTAAAAVETRELPVQVNGKLRDRVEVAVGLPKPRSRRWSWRARRSSRARWEDTRARHSRRRRPPREHRRQG